MSRVRRLFLVLLFALSLPLQSYAMASMACGSASDAAPAQVMPPMAAAAHPASCAAPRHHMAACSLCAACCCGVALPAAAFALPALVALGHAAPFPLFVALPPFLTGGIERPPRSRSV